MDSSARTLPYRIVDAFTASPLSGNACAVVFDAGALTEPAMLAIAREFNLAETVFLVPPLHPDTDFSFRYFTPAEELPLAGHPTLGAVRALFDEGLIRLPAHRPLRIETRSGMIEVQLQGQEVEGGFQLERICMSQQPPRFGEVFSPDLVAPALGLCAGDLCSPVQVVSTGTPMLMVRVHTPECLERIRVDVGEFLRMREVESFVSIHVFAVLPETAESMSAEKRPRTLARNFGLPPDLPEDAFTGSATGCMGCYLYRYGLVKGTSLVALQGESLGRPGSAEVTLTGTPENITGIQVAGSAVSVMRGMLLL